MKKELRPTLDPVSCEICGRTILKGERTEAYLVPGGQRKLVCDLCTARAEHEGWIRESAHDDMPATGRRAEPRRGLRSRLGRRRGEEPDEAVETQGAAVPAGDLPPEYEEPARPKDPRHVRAVPTNAQVKFERALEVLNGSEHIRTIGGIARTLGQPWVNATPVMEAPSEVEVVVAWELSWYRYRVDLAAEDEPVTLVDKGQEVGELTEGQRAWNAFIDEDGRLTAGVVSTER